MTWSVKYIFTIASRVDIGSSFKCRFLYFLVIPAYDCSRALIYDSSRPSALLLRVECGVISFLSLLVRTCYFYLEYSIYISDFLMMFLRTSVASSPHDFSYSGFSLYAHRWYYGLVSYHFTGSKCAMSLGSPSSLMAAICSCPSYISSIIEYVVAEASL